MREHKPGGSFLGAPEIFSLGLACHLVGRALGETCYLVGSVNERPDFRDVDVRVIMDDAKYAALFGAGGNGEVHVFWSLFCTATSEYLAKRTGLRIDFQVQKRSAVAEADWDKVRLPLGIYLVDHDEAATNPVWREKTS
jgi:hypothetical protein